MLSWRWISLVWMFLGLMLFYTILRGLFLYYNAESYEHLQFNQVLSAFVHGWRFDASAILQTNAVFFLLWMFLPAFLLQKKWVDKGLLFLFLAWNYVLFSANTADMELHQFNGRRMTFDFFRISGDIQGQAGSVLSYYWKLATWSAILLGLYILFLRPLKKWRLQFAVVKKRPLYVTIPIGFLFFVLLVIGVRGGLQLKPLRPTHAFVFQEDGLGTLALNSTFTLFRGKSSSDIHRVSYFATSDEVESFLKKGMPPHLSVPNAKDVKNIVILVVESLSLEYMGRPNKRQGYTPFLDSLIDQSLFYANHFSNGRRSIEAVPSLLAGIPSLMLEPFITSSFQTNKVVGLGSILKASGYNTHFFHGAENGSMFFDSFTRRLGFDHYYGLNEYPHPQRDWDGNWGVFDEPFLQYSLEKTNQFDEPFLSVLFTLSSHHPYAIPKKYAGLYSKGTLEIHESIGYTDDSLKKYFERAQKESWFDRTLFIITGDHTQKSYDERYKNIRGHFRVPLIIYSPAVNLNQFQSQWANQRVSQHVDLLPSILHWLNIPTSTGMLFGHSLFVDSYAGYAFNFHQEKIWLFDQQGYLSIDDAGSFVGFKDNEEQDFSPSEERKSLLRAYKQYYQNGLIDNSWIVPL